MLTLLEPIVDALMYLHQQEPPVLHRDIKPANIITLLTGVKPVNAGKQEEQASVLHSPKTGKQGNTRSGKHQQMAVFSLVRLVLIVGGLGLLLSSKHPATPTPVNHLTTSKG